MAYIESHQELGSHPKTRKLARLLGISRVTAVGHLQFLWWWATDYAGDGCLARFDPLDIAVGAEWDGDPEAFLAALIDAGFVDPDRAIHDWDLYGGKLAERRTRNAERMRAARAREAHDTDRAEHVQHTQRARVQLEKRREEKRRQAAAPPTPPTANGSPQQQPPIESRNEPPIESPNGADPAGYVAQIGVPLTKLVGSVTRIEPQITEPWLRETLGAIEVRVGPLPRDRLVKGLDLAFDQFRRKHGAGKVESPRGFAARLIEDYLREQLTDGPTESGPTPRGRSP